MRAIWIAGVFHAVIGSFIFFLTLHPLRDALDAHALDLARTGSTWQAVQGALLMIAAIGTRARIASLVIIVGATLSAAMLYFITFTGLRPPIIVLIPIGGSIATLGAFGLLFAEPTGRD